MSEGVKVTGKGHEVVIEHCEFYHCCLHDWTVHPTGLIRECHKCGAVQAMADVQECEHHKWEVDHLERCRRCIDCGAVDPISDDEMRG